MEKKIIITGATGFLGSHILESLGNNYDDDIIQGTSRINQFNDNKIIYANLIESESINIIKNCEILINAAYDNSNYSNNYLITKNIIAATKYKKIKTIIHISTAVVCGIKKSLAVNEKSINNPDNLYQSTKLSIEQQLMDNLDVSIKLVILRPTMIIGKNSNNLDFILNNYNTNTFSYFFLKERHTNFISINNIIDVIFEIINHPSNYKDEIYILSQDYDPNNNYGSLDRIIREHFKIPKRKINITIPKNIIRFIFLIFKKNVYPFKIFNSVNLTYRYKQDIKSAIIENISDKGINENIKRT